MPTRIHSAILFATSLSLALAGCASHSTQVIARCGSQPLSADAKNIGLMRQAQARPQDQALERVVAVELERSGYRIVPQPEADYTLACFVEDNWVTHVRPSHTPLPYSPPSPRVMYQGNRMYVERWTQTSPGARNFTQQQVEDHVPTQGIRLRLYSNQSLRANRFETTWDGYINAGLKLRPEEQLPLVRALLAHFGRDFAGEVKLAQQP